MNNAPEQRPQYDAEISLVDLAIIFIRRRWIFYVVFLIFTLAGVAYALVQTDVYQYTSLIQVAEKSSGKYIEEPETTIATLENRWMPEQETLFRAEHDRDLPLSVSFANPDKTGLIRFVSETSIENKEFVASVHQNLIDKIQDRQKALIEREEKSLRSRIDSAERAIETLQSGQDMGTAIAEAYERKVGFESDLEAIRGPEVLVVSRESAHTTGPARAQIIVITLFLAGMIGIIFAFLAEFGSAVRAAFESDKR